MPGAVLLLRLGLAFSFLYAGVGGLVDPANWVGFVPRFLQFRSEALLVLGILEILLALWLLWGRYVRAAALVSFVLLSGVVLGNLNLLLVVFRDISLAVSALALYALSRTRD